jgi:opacity protein-like surface antigen
MKNHSLYGVALLATVAALANPTVSRAQAFDEETNSVSVGYGFVTLLGSINDSFDTYNDTEYSQLGPIYAKFEHAVSDHLGIGLNFAYATNEWSYRYDSFDSDLNATQYVATNKRSTWSALVRLNWHFGDSDKFDPYAGLGLGYRNATWSYETTDPSGSESGVTFKTLVPLGMEMTIGARYFFTESIGAYLEVGAAKSVVQAGLAFKF